MKQIKRIWAMLLAAMLVISSVPTGADAASAQSQSAQTIAEEAYADVEAVFDKLDNLPATKSGVGTQKIADTVTASADYREGSLEVKGSTVIWWTTSGIRCIYSPSFAKIAENFVPENSIDEIVNEPAAKRGGSPSSREVYLIAPYYGIDASFSDQYKTEAANIARAIGDTDGCTVYSGRVATIDKVAEAVSKGAVVLFDSHGTTDYEDGFDKVTGATNSFLCLNNVTGITDADYAVGAAYGGDGTVFVNGQTIANHMQSNSPGGICWFATCLSMATDTLCTPLRNKGVEVVYGYSQSVSFDGEYLFSETFWDTFLQEGKTVGQAVYAMKQKWGTWDTSKQIAAYYGWAIWCDDIDMARKAYKSFPVVVSDEDAYPGQRSASSWGADSLQTVWSTYTLGSLPGNGSSELIEPTIPIDPSDGSGYDRVRYWVETEGSMVGGWPTMAITEDTQDVRYTWMLQSTDKGLLLYYSHFNFDFDVDCTDEYVSILLCKNDPCFYVSAKFNSYEAGGLKIDQLNFTETFNADAHRKGDSYIAPASDNGTLSADTASRMLTADVNSLLDTWDTQFNNALGFGLDYLGFVNYHTVAAVPGDLNSDDKTDNDDVLLLLWHTLFPEQNLLPVSGDLNGDGKADNDDVLLLLWHTLFPDQNPLNV